MNFLFEDTISPITSCIGFLEIDFESAVNSYEEWMKPILKEYGFTLERETVSGNLRDTLLKLQPLVSPVRTKFLFMPTSSNWTAFLDNGWQGTDASSPIQVLSERLSCNGLAVTAVTHTMPSKIKNDTKGRYGATIMEVYGSNGNFIRTIFSSNDGGKWIFGESGDPFEFEDLKLYKAKKIRDRFTPETLEKYLKYLGIDAFNEDFYLPVASNRSILLIKKGAFPANFKEYTLREIRAAMGED